MLGDGLLHETVDETAVAEILHMHEVRADLAYRVERLVSNSKLYPMRERIPGFVASRSCIWSV